MRRPVIAVFSLAAVLALTAGAARAGTEHRAADPGVAPTSLLLGGTTPLSGTASAYAAVARGPTPISSTSTRTEA